MVFKTKKFKVVLSLVLVFTMLFGGGSVFANNTSQEESEYVVTYSAEEEKDINKLISMAKSKNNYNDVKMFSINSENKNDNQNTQLEVDQLLEERLYKNGMVEQDYAVTAVAGDLVNGVESKQNPYFSEYGYILACSIHYTKRLNHGGTPQYCVNKVETTVVKTNSSTTVRGVRGTHMYRVTETEEHSGRFDYSNSSMTTTQTFTLYSRHSGFYTSAGDSNYAPIYGVGAQSTFDLSNGKGITVHVAASK